MKVLMEDFLKVYLHIEPKILITFSSEEFEGTSYFTKYKKKWGRLKITDNIYVGNQEWISGTLRCNEKSWWCHSLLGKDASIWLNRTTDPPNIIKVKLIQLFLQDCKVLPWNYIRVRHEIIAAWKNKTLEKCILSTCILLKILNFFIIGK